MTTPEDLIRRYVDVTSAADGEAAAALMADDAVIELPDGGVLKGKEGARQFAAKHAEVDGRKQSVSLTSLDARTPDRFVATLVMSNREVATDELLYSMDVGGVFEVRDGLITRNQVFPSHRGGRCRG
jgi:ketosteroid isomerase-like protein